VRDDLDLNLFKGILEERLAAIRAGREAQRREGAPVELDQTKVGTTAFWPLKSRSEVKKRGQKFKKNHKIEHLLKSDPVTVKDFQARKDSASGRSFVF